MSKYKPSGKISNSYHKVLTSLFKELTSIDKWAKDHKNQFTEKLFLNTQQYVRPHS